MKVLVHYNKIARGMSLIKASSFKFTKEFNSIDEARQWVDTTDEPIFNISLEVQ